MLHCKVSHQFLNSTAHILFTHSEQTDSRKYRVKTETCRETNEGQPCLPRNGHSPALPVLRGALLPPRELHPGRARPARATRYSQDPLKTLGRPPSDLIQLHLLSETKAWQSGIPLGCSGNTGLLLLFSSVPSTHPNEWRQTPILWKAQVFNLTIPFLWQKTLKMTLKSWPLHLNCIFKILHLTGDTLKITIMRSMALSHWTKYLSNLFLSWSSKTQRILYSLRDLSRTL